MSTALVIGFDLIPARLLDVAVLEHGVFGFGILHPSLTGAQVHRAEFPQFRRITRPLLKTPLLFLIADRQPIFDQVDARAYQETLELRTSTNKLPVFVVAAKAHHMLDASSVVPTTIKNHDLTGSR